MKKKWPQKVKEAQEQWRDFRSDFCETVMEVARDNTLAQVAGIVFITACYFLLVLLIWGIISLLIAFPVWGLLNALDQGSFGYWKSYCLTLLCAILFKGHSIYIYLNEDKK